jgi:hypothetical protein
MPDSVSARWEGTLRRLADAVTGQKNGAPERREKVG